jgi:hypothetical protein
LITAVSGVHKAKWKAVGHLKLERGPFPSMAIRRVVFSEFIIAFGIIPYQPWFIPQVHELETKLGLQKQLNTELKQGYAGLHHCPYLILSYMFCPTHVHFVQFLSRNCLASFCGMPLNNVPFSFVSSLGLSVPQIFQL